MKLLVLVVLCIFSLANAQVRWQTGRDGQVPNNSVPGGRIQGQNIFVCRALFGGDMNSGYLDPTIGACFFGWDGRVHSVRTYETATGTHRWPGYIRGELIPNNAVLVGWTVNRDRVFACRAQHPSGQISGRLLRGTCLVAAQGMEHQYTVAQILVDPAA